MYKSGYSCPDMRRLMEAPIVDRIELLLKEKLARLMKASSVNRIELLIKK